jgi:hypothetical protein
VQLGGLSKLKKKITLLGNIEVYPGESQQTFWRNMSPISSGPKRIPAYSWTMMMDLSTNSTALSSRRC